MDYKYILKTNLIPGIKHLMILALGMLSIGMLAQPFDSILIRSNTLLKKNINTINFDISNCLLSDNDLFIIGKSYYKSKKYSDAIKIFNNLCNKSDTSVSACYGLALAYSRIDSSETYAMAKPYFEVLLERIKKDTVKYRKELSHYYRYFGTYYYSSKRNNDSAIYYYDKLLYMANNHVPSLLIAAYSGLILAHLQNEDFEKAFEYAYKLEKIEPTSSAVFIVDERKREFMARPYILPSNIDEALMYFEKRWSEKSKESFRNMPEDKAVSAQHFGVGLWIRNNWVRGDRNPVFYNYFKSMGVSEPDYISGIVLTTLHRKLNNRDIDLKTQLTNCQDYKIEK